MILITLVFSMTYFLILKNWDLIKDFIFDLF